MAKIQSVADVFIDTNILKFSVVKKHVFHLKKSIINWGGVEHEVEWHEPHTTNDLHKIKNETQKRDAVVLGILAYAGISNRLKFHSHIEVDLETWNLPGMASPHGRFFGCPINEVADPISTQSRVIMGGSKTFKEHKLEFLSGIQHPRFVELTKMTGAFQGSKNPLNLNQALDAYHIWCAECAGMNYKLQKVVKLSKINMSVVIITPKQLLMEVLPKFGLFGAIKFMWQGYRFAKPLIGFDEGKGWT